MTNVSNEQLQQVMDYSYLFRTLNGERVCQTGTLSMARAQFEYLIRELGGEVHNSIKSSTTILIVPNGEFRQGSKYNAAVKHGLVAILSEQEFCARILPTLDQLHGGHYATAGSAR